MLRSILLVSLLILSVSSQKCYGVAFEGGGGKGAYEAGVMFAFANATGGPVIAYNIISGISIGAVNAGLASQFAIGDELDMSLNMLRFWQTLNGSDSIYKKWKGGDIDGLLFQKGLYDNSPSVELGKIWFKNAPVRNISVGSTNLDTGLFDTFDNSVGKAIIDAVISSGSVPFFFPPHEFEGYSWADGGCILNLDVGSVINKCLGAGFAESDIIVDMILDDPYKTLVNETSLKTLGVLERMYSIRGYDGTVKYLYNAKTAYPDVKFRYTVQASQPMPSLLNFSKAAIDFGIALGMKDGNAALKSASTGLNIIDELYNEIKTKIIYP